MRLSDSRLIRVQDDFGLFIIDMQTTQQEDEPRESGIAGDGFQPVIWDIAQVRLVNKDYRETLTIKTEENHLRLSRSL